MSNIWFTSDLHLNHENIITFGQRNKFHTIKDMNNYIIDVWNSYIKYDDTVYVIGDFILGPSDEFELTQMVAHLNGRIHLIPGNHDTDKKINCYKKHGVLDVEDKVKNLKIGNGIVMCHFPMLVWQNSHHGSIMLHGHTHGRLNSNGKIMDVGVDTNSEMRPYNLEEILEIMSHKSTSNHDNREIKQ